MKIVFVKSLASQYPGKMLVARRGDIHSDNDSDNDNDDDDDDNDNDISKVC